MVKLKLLPWWQFHFSECRIIQGRIATLIILLCKKEELVSEIMVIGTLGESECVILEFVVMKEGRAVVYGPTSIIGFRRTYSKN